MTDLSIKNFSDIYYTSRDGLRLYARHYHAASRSAQAREPVVCIAGLTRNSRDFHKLASAIAADQTSGRDVYTLDYRGRGNSDFDPNWRNYALQVEMYDVLDFLTLRNLHKVTLCGTSRGGLVSMLIGAAQPSVIGRVILNDIGPVIDTAGLARIAGYVGRTPLPANWQQAADLLKRHNQAHFTKVTDDEWVGIAKQWFNERDGKPAPGYDKKLGQALAALKGKIPELWPQFETLKHASLLILRGENSDLLSEQTVTEMLRRHPRATAHTVPNEGHAPLLNDRDTQSVIIDFLRDTD